MADDWQPGDLALCVYRPPQTWFGAKPGRPEPRKGGVYTVEALIVHPFTGELGLVLEGHHSAHPSGPAWCSRSYRKIRPHTPDAEDRETIRLLNGAPVKETV